MKQLVLISCLLFGSLFGVRSQVLYTQADSSQVLIDNHLFKITAIACNPGQHFSGLGMYSDNTFLAVLLTDASVLLTTQEGHTHKYELKAGATFWGKAETHIVVYNGSGDVKFYLIEAKSRFNLYDLHHAGLIQLPTIHIIEKFVQSIYQ